MVHWENSSIKQLSIFSVKYLAKNLTLTHLLGWRTSSDEFCPQLSAVYTCQSISLVSISQINNTLACSQSVSLTPSLSLSLYIYFEAFISKKQKEGLKLKKENWCFFIWSKLKEHFLVKQLLGKTGKNWIFLQLASYDSLLCLISCQLRS